MSELVFNATDHSYWKDGLRIPSVTEILTVTGYIDTRWMRSDAMDRGSLVHEYTAWVEKGVAELEDLVDLEETGPYMAAYQDFVKATGWKSISVELPRSCEWLGFGYAGTPDRVGTFGWDMATKMYGVKGGPDIAYILDFKTGCFQDWHPLQLFAYERLVNADRRPGEERFPYFLTVDVYLKKNGRWTMRFADSSWARTWEAALEEYDARLGA